MDGLLRAVESVDRNGDKQHEPSHINFIQTRTLDKQKVAPIREDITTAGNARSQTPKSTKPPTSQSTSDQSVPERPNDVVGLLRSEPSIEVLLATLKRLSTPGGFGDDFNLATPGPSQSRIANAIVTTIVPVYWPTLGKGDRRLLIECLTNVAGLGAIVARLKFLAPQSHSQGSSSLASTVTELLDVLKVLLRGDSLIVTIRAKLEASTDDKLKLDLTWKEFVNLVASGKIISTVAEAEDALKSSASDYSSSWLSNGPQYAAWLGRCIASAVLSVERNDPNDALKQYSLPLVRSLSIGYPIPLLRSLHIALFKHPSNQHDSQHLKALLNNLPPHSRRQYLAHTIRWLSTTVDSGQNNSKAAQEASSVAALLCILSQQDAILQNHLLTMLGDPPLLSSLPQSIRRACLATLNAQVPDELESLMEKSLASFGDLLFIKHGPTIQQESLAQTLLTTAGYIHRRTPMALLMAARSSNHMQGVSNRLDATNGRARWLGMVVGTALSSLVDKEGVKMDFGTEEMRSEDAAWYLDLTKISDEIGSLGDFIRLVDHDQIVTRSTKTAVSKPQPMPKIDGKPTFGPLRPPEKKQTEVEGEKVTEILDTDSDLDSDNSLKPYTKPDSDPEDSDEDATLVNRHKPRPPVYIRDLMASLRATENADRFQLGLQHAAPLIRRKTSFGREVLDHAEELARILCNLNDPFSTPNFDDLRLQALIALILSNPSTMAPWLSRQTFIGDYSLAQRSIILTALGLSGRELAGLKEPDALNPSLPSSTFPSKTLPPHLHALYTPHPASRLSTAHTTLTQILLQPLANRALDQTTSHLSALKTRPTSTRLAKSRTPRPQPRNNLAPIFPQAYFFPLLNAYRADLAAYGPTSSLWTTTSILLVTLLKTLALLLHASGPATAELPDVTAEFWELLLALRVQATGDVAVLEALLFAFVVVLEVQVDLRGLAEGFAPLLEETRAWVEMVFERSQQGGGGGGGGAGGLIQVQEGKGEEVKVRTLAAALLVKIGEIGEEYRRVLMGGMAE